MAECFIYGQSGGNSTNNTLILFEGKEDDYILADSFTGFSPLYSDGVTIGGDTGIIQFNGQGSYEKYGQQIAKAYSIYAEEAQYTDSVVICSNEEIDLTDYHMICCEFYGYCDYPSSSMTLKQRELTGAYFKIDQPATLPESKKAYDWSDWDNVNANCFKNGKYYYNISNITGKHYICFGIWHGNYADGYTNGIKIYKLFLI